MISRGLFPSMDSPLKRIFPFSSACKPAMASQSSFCPQPETPATPKISPLFNSKDTLSSAKVPSSPLTVTPSSSSRISPGVTSGCSMDKLMACPIMRSVNSLAVVAEVSTVATLLPFRKMVTRSEISITSFNLWVMMIIAQPASRIFRRMAKSFLVSCRVSTAVGSSKIKISAPLYNTFKISTVCFSLTAISPTIFLGSISKPKLSQIVRIFSYRSPVNRG